MELGKYNDAITYLEVALKNGFEPRIQIMQKLANIYLKQEDLVQTKFRLVELYLLKIKKQTIGK